MARRALLCGINDYKSVRDLRGCIRDVENMRDLLTGAFGFRPEDVHVLTDRDVVKSKLKTEWKWLMKGAGLGDTLVFHFSGHGSYLPDEDGNEEDRRDELLCLYDMDFGSSKTFLLDDELARWLADKPDGADLVVVTDCCHSGSNTRLVLDDVNGRLVTFALDQDSTVRMAAATGEAAAEVEVLARFLPPPDYVPARDRRTRGAATKAARPPLNHLHLAACRDDETASDAPIAGQYNGAFTYHLCRTLRGEPRLGSDDLVSRLAGSLTSFDQHPLANGGPRPGPLFGGAAPPAPTRPGTPPDPPRPDSGLTEATGRELLAAVRDLTAALTRRPAAPGRAAGRRVLVYVHGIDEHPGDFSGPWWAALRPHIGGNVYGEGPLGDTRFGVHWSDIVNPRALASRDPAVGPEAEVVRTMIARALEERSAAYADRGRAVDARAGVAARGDGPQLDDFVRYMFRPAIRARVLERFTDVVRTLLAAGDTLDVIAHSWGTVVAYEGLLLLEPEGLPGRVANLITAGAALSIGPVRWQLGLGGQRPAAVGRWVNVDAKGDSIGGQLAGSFPVDVEYLEQEPTGCTRGWFGYNLVCAHMSYFRDDNVVVNRDIFARHILEG